MARKRRRRRSQKLPILTIAALAIPVVEAFREHERGGDAIAHYVGSYIPFNLSTHQFETAGLWRGIVPLAAVGLTKKFLFPIIGRPRIPMVPVSLS